MRRRFPLAVWWIGPVLLGCAALALIAHTRRSEKPAPPAAESPDTAECELCMERAQREYLWEVEHHGNVLVKYGFRPLADALGRADRQAVAAILHAEFQGEAPQQPRDVSLATPAVRVARHEDAGSARQPLRPEEWLAQLFAYRDAFRQPPRVQLSLMTLAPTVPGDLDSPWQGTCVLRMWGEAEPGRPREVVLHLQYRLPRPTESLFEQNGWLRSCAVTQSQVGQATHFLFRDATAESGLDPRPLHDNWLQRQKLPNTGGVYVCDVNRDGLLDVLVTDVNVVVFYQGLPGGKFRDVTAEVGLPARRPVPSTLAAFVDLDGDGWEDLILGTGVYRNVPLTPNPSPPGGEGSSSRPVKAVLDAPAPDPSPPGGEGLGVRGGRRFVDVTARTNLRIPDDINGVVTADYDRDGRLDLYLTHVARQGKSRATSYLDGRSGDPEGNQLWRNLGDWQFEDVTAKSGTDGGGRSAFTAIWFDANNDGWPDLYVPNEFGNGTVLVNRGDGTFRDTPLAEGPCDFGTMGATCGDIDNDGHLDVYAANMYSKAGTRVIGNVRPDTYPEEVMAKMRRFVSGSQLHRNRGQLAFEQLGQACQVAAVGWAYGPVLADLDNDGWLDIYATAGFLSNSRSDPDG
jgi:hypothetical protein